MLELWHERTFQSKVPNKTNAANASDDDWKKKTLHIERHMRRKQMVRCGSGVDAAPTGFFPIPPQIIGMVLAPILWNIWLVAKCL